MPPVAKNLAPFSGPPNDPLNSISHKKFRRFFSGSCQMTPFYSERDESDFSSHKIKYQWSKASHLLVAPSPSQYQIQCTYHQRVVEERFGILIPSIWRDLDGESAAIWQRTLLQMQLNAHIYVIIRVWNWRLIGEIILRASDWISCCKPGPRCDRLFHPKLGVGASDAWEKCQKDVITEYVPQYLHN